MLKELVHAVELMNEMLPIQKELDDQIKKEHDIFLITNERYHRAILDEIGELNHELKADWCWWKFTQPKIDREKVLGELADVWHFALSYFLNNLNSQIPDKVFVDMYYRNVETFNEKSLSESFVEIIVSKSPIYRLVVLYMLTERLGFTIDDVYKAYMEKNKINHERVENGY